MSLRLRGCKRAHAHTPCDALFPVTIEYSYLVTVVFNPDQCEEIRQLRLCDSKECLLCLFGSRYLFLIKRLPCPLNCFSGVML